MATLATVYKKLPSSYLAITALPAARENTAGSLNNAGYGSNVMAVAGGDSGGADTATTYRLVGGVAWSTDAAVTTARSYPNGCAFNQLFYVYGGQNSSTDVATSYRFNLASYSQGANPFGVGISEDVSVFAPSVNLMLLCCGRSNGSAADVNETVTAAEVFTTAGTIGYNRTRSFGGYIAGSVYRMGGGPDADPANSLTTAGAYNFSSWSAKNAIPVAIGLAACTLDGAGLSIIGGRGLAGSATSIVTNYNGVSFTTSAAQPTATYNSGASTV